MHLTKNLVLYQDWNFRSKLNKKHGIWQGKHKKFQPKKWSILLKTIHAPESRTSSPVRIPRDEITLEHLQIKGLYPCGEGAGYAGGIISAAIDGEKCAAQIAFALKHK